MARRRPTKNIKEVRPTIIGAGITEQWYFTHLQSLFGLKIKIRPRYFGHETMNLLAKRIEQVLSDEGKAVVVFDTDVTTWDDMEKKRFEQLKKKYAKNSNNNRENDFFCFAYGSKLIHLDFALFFGS